MTTQTLKQLEIELIEELLEEKRIKLRHIEKYVLWTYLKSLKYGDSQQNGWRGADKGNFFKI